jgi:hypothetical protein
MEDTEVRRAEGTMNGAKIGSSARTRAPVPREKTAWAVKSIIAMADYCDAEELAGITVC